MTLSTICINSFSIINICVCKGPTARYACICLQNGIIPNSKVHCKILSCMLKHWRPYTEVVFARIRGSSKGKWLTIFPLLPDLWKHYLYWNQTCWMFVFLDIQSDQHEPPTFSVDRPNVRLFCIATCMENSDCSVKTFQVFGNKIFQTS